MKTRPDQRGKLWCAPAGVSFLGQTAILPFDIIILARLVSVPRPAAVVCTAPHLAAAPSPPCACNFWVEAWPDPARFASPAQPRRRDQVLRWLGFERYIAASACRSRVSQAVPSPGYTEIPKLDCKAMMALSTWYG